MILALDAAYGDTIGAVAAVGFADWPDAVALNTWSQVVSGVGDYESGAFYRRELPLLLAVLGKAAPTSLLVVDGYVWLDAHGRPGLGARLHEATGLPVVGVAKTAFQGADAWAMRVQRGGGQTPLYVTTVGLEAGAAAEAVAAMHGPHRLPTHLKAADALARRALREAQGTR